MSQNRKSVLIIALIAAVTLLSLLRLPYGKFLWSTAAQYYGDYGYGGYYGGGGGAPLPAGVSNRFFLAGAGAQIFQNQDHSFDIYGDCQGDNCTLLASFSVDDLLQCWALPALNNQSLEQTPTAATPEATAEEAFECEFVELEVPAPEGGDQTQTIQGLLLQEQEEGWYALVFYMGQQNADGSISGGMQQGGQGGDAGQGGQGATPQGGDTTQQGGTHLFQINLYDEASNLLDDTTWLLISSDGMITMQSGQ